MTITLQAVNELIASLESAGEPSIREQKFLKLAKAFKQLAAENVALKGGLTGNAYISFIKANGWNASASTVNGKFVNFADPEVDFGAIVFAHAKKLIDDIKTPVTDSIYAVIKADGVEEFIGRLQQCVDEGDFVGDEVAVIVGAIDCGKEFCEQLRDGGSHD
ncbi:hypothetical protein EQH51_03825 [Klebsiella pneumoniae]|uniref:hypothetical protein n=1 Tax=Klebsiella pneumoniae TaxID=573 RepID=UPI00128CAF10|nr:hypothetical protein [Klebsiella pneumoniae]QFU68950.1 hypothetical protein EQH51_03825 [Klebsiella pneumoniae]